MLREVIVPLIHPILPLLFRKSVTDLDQDSTIKHGLVIRRFGFSFEAIICPGAIVPCRANSSLTSLTTLRHGDQKKKKDRNDQKEPESNIRASIRELETSMTKLIISMNEVICAENNNQVNHIATVSVLAIQIESGRT